MEGTERLPVFWTNPAIRADLEAVVRTMTAGFLDLQDELGPDHPELEPLLLALASMLEASGSIERARALLRRAIDRRERHPEPNDETLAILKLRLAVLTTSRA